MTEAGNAIATSAVRNGLRELIYQATSIAENVAGMVPGQQMAHCASDLHKKLREIDRVMLAAAPDNAEQKPVHGDVLPPVGTDVLIHLASKDAWQAHEVTGYYAWPSLNGSVGLQRVFVCVRDSAGYPNARMLCDVRRLDGTAYVHDPNAAQQGGSQDLTDEQVKAIGLAHGLIANEDGRLFVAALGFAEMMAAIRSLLATQPATNDRVLELESVLRSVAAQFERVGDRFPDAFDARVVHWVRDALAGVTSEAGVIHGMTPSLRKALIAAIVEHTDSSESWAAAIIQQALLAPSEASAGPVHGGGRTWEGEALSLAGTFKRYDANGKEDPHGALVFFLDVLEAVRIASALPKDPDVALLASMATCQHHGFGTLPAEAQRRMLVEMRKLYDEVVGQGYYRPENRQNYIRWVSKEIEGGERESAGLADLFARQAEAVDVGLARVALHEAILTVLMEHGLSHTEDTASGEKFPLIDKLCAPGDDTIETGKREAVVLAEAILEVIPESIIAATPVKVKS